MEDRESRLPQQSREWTRAAALCKGNVRGRLIALEGPSGYLTADSARDVLKRIGGMKVHGGASCWDASSVFTELLLTDPNPGCLSPRSLILLYASDLLFRLRWQIRPTLEQGQWVIATPYVESAVAFGLTSGLEEHWLRDLFEFAPAPDETYRCESREPLRPPNMPFLGCLADLLARGSSVWNQWELQVGFNACLESLGNKGRWGILEIGGSVRSR